MKKILSLILSAVMALSMAVTVVAADIQDTAKELELGKTVSGKMSYLKGEQKDYKITVTKKGTLNITFENWDTTGLISVYDSDDRYIQPTETETIQGWITKDPDYVYCHINDVSKKQKSILSYEVKKGTYYVRIVAYNTNDKDFKLTAKMASTTEDDSSSSSSPIVVITLDKGDTIKLGTTSNSNCTYKSSNTAVATVTSGGKVKTVKKGTADIKIKNGSKTITVRIKVVD